MANLSADRNTPRRGDGVSAAILTLPVKSNQIIFKGAIVGTVEGYAVPGSQFGSPVAGVAESSADNTSGADGAISVQVRRGQFKFDNQSDDLVPQQQLFYMCYGVDDHTVAHTDGIGSRGEVGIVLGIDSDGVWVEVGLTHLAVVGG